jgi:hypothetical protein
LSLLPLQIRVKPLYLTTRPWKPSATNEERIMQRSRIETLFASFPWSKEICTALWFVRQPTGPTCNLQISANRPLHSHSRWEWRLGSVVWNPMNEEQAIRTFAL